MARYTTVSRGQHSGKFWNRPDSYDFAGSSSIVPLVAAELRRAMMDLPIGFVQNGKDYTPVGILSLERARNLFVCEGRWIGGYVPSVYRSYPFRLLPTEKKQHVLCIDEDSGLVQDEADGFPFFDDQGELATSTRQVLEFLVQVEKNRIATRRACEALSKHGVIVPWTIIVDTNAVSQKPIEGVFKVDEAGLNALSTEAFEELRQVGAVALAYCQMLSMQRLQMLGRLTEAHARRSTANDNTRVPSLESLLAPADDGNIDVDWSNFDSDEEE